MQEETAPAPDTGGKSLEELLAEAQAKIEQQRDTLMRALAEAENARKRALADAASAQKYAVERFAESLLPVMDSLEAALKAQDASGIEITQRQLKSALDKASVREVAPAAGERFDPNRHQAMAAVPAEVEPNSVVAVLQKGYVLHERVLRPALVTVAKAAADPISEQDPN
jgi:molecular chaperone GrpE